MDNYEGKKAFLRELVADAMVEGSETGTKPFEGAFDTPAMDRLEAALRTTDALNVLYRVLEEQS